MLEDKDKNKDTDIIRAIDQSILNSLEINENLPCDKCNGDCCGPVMFEINDLSRIFEKYSKRKAFKKRFPWNEFSIGNHLELRQAFPNTKTHVIATFKGNAYYRKRGLDSGSCIFKDNEETGGCVIYEDRPLVCREYGKRECLRCPYSGLEEQPKDLDERKNLVIKGHTHRQQQLLIEQQAFLNFKI